MTDGQSDIDMGVVQEAAAEHITIFTIGFGDVNDELLQSIADQTEDSTCGRRPPTSCSRCTTAFRGSSATR